MTVSGRIMSLDHGQRRIGIAFSDPLQLTAQPHSVLQRTSLKDDFREIRTLVSEQDTVKVVIGLPSDSTDGIGPQATTIIRWARKLKQEIQIPIVFWDESFSSEYAASTEEARRRRAKASGAPIDDLAAAVILQDYLSATHRDNESGSPLEQYDYIQ